jgi:hypothetical protein
MQAETTETESTFRETGEAYGHRPGFRLRFGTTGRREAAKLGFRALAPRNIRGLRAGKPECCARLLVLNGFEY